MILEYHSKFARGLTSALVGAGLLFTGALGGSALAQVEAPTGYSQDEVFACMLYIEVWRKTLPEDRQSFPSKAVNWWFTAYDKQQGPPYRLFDDDVRARLGQDQIKAGFQACMRIYQGDKSADLSGPMRAIRGAVAMGPPLVDQRAAAKREEYDQAEAERAEGEQMAKCESAAKAGLDGALKDMKEANRMMANWNATQRFGTNYAWEPFERGCRRLASTMRTMENMGCPASASNYVQNIQNQYVLYFDSGPEYCKPHWQ